MIGRLPANVSRSDIAERERRAFWERKRQQDFLATIDDLLTAPVKGKDGGIWL